MSRRNPCLNFIQNKPVSIISPKLGQHKFEARIINMAEIVINEERFYQRLERLQTQWAAEKSTVWAGADCICVAIGGRSEEGQSTKASALHLYLLGYEIVDSIMMICKNSFWFMSSEKKCKYLERSLADKSQNITFKSLHKTKDEGMNREHFNALLGFARKGGGSKLGFLSQDLSSPFMQSWEGIVNQSQLEKVDVTAPIGTLLSIKDDFELVSYWLIFILLMVFLCRFCFKHPGPVSPRCGLGE